MDNGCVFIPVTRTWSIDAVVGALDASDAPKRVMLLADAPHCLLPWYLAFSEREWDISYYETGNPAPPEGRLERRARHFFMRRLSQTLMDGMGRILFIEDDTLVPPDVWSRLSIALDGGYIASSGVQIDRHGSGLYGVWDYDDAIECFDPAVVPDYPCVFEADAVGHYCLMTTGTTYANCVISGHDTSIDRQHTFAMRPIAVDSGVRCGHLLPTGEVLL